jgi:hypothetical protein
MCGRLAADKYLALTRRFATAYRKMKDRPEVIEIIEDVKSYIATLKSLGLKV